MNGPRALGAFLAAVASVAVARAAEVPTITCPVADQAGIQGAAQDHLAGVLAEDEDGTTDRRAESAGGKIAEAPPGSVVWLPAESRCPGCPTAGKVVSAFVLVLLTSLLRLGFRAASENRGWSTSSSVSTLLSDETYTKDRSWADVAWRSERHRSSLAEGGASDEPTRSSSSSSPAARTDRPGAAPPGAGDRAGPGPDGVTIGRTSLTGGARPSMFQRSFGRTTEGTSWPASP